MRSRLLLYISVLSSAAYVLTTRWQPFPGSAALKGVPVGALALMALNLRWKRQDAALLAAALGLSTAGDILLDLDPKLFVLGLGAFLLAQITYIALFWRNRAPGIRLEPPLLAGILLVIAYSATLSAWIVPSVGDLSVPVVFYICALTAMVVSALLARFRWAWVAAGAILFMVSDSILAINRFKTPVPGHEYLIWSTYYLGQCAIALGYLESAAAAG